jgi:hypothetical protein
MEFSSALEAIWAVIAVRIAQGMSAIIRNQNSSLRAMDRLIAAAAGAGPGSTRSPNGVSAADGPGATGGKDCMVVSAQAGWGSVQKGHGGPALRRSPSAIFAHLSRRCDPWHPKFFAQRQSRHNRHRRP